MSIGWIIACLIALAALGEMWSILARMKSTSDRMGQLVAESRDAVPNLTALLHELVTGLLDELIIRVAEVADSAHRIERAASTAAKAAEQVADELEHSQGRADAVDGLPGAAADAASQSAPLEGARLGDV